MILAPATAVGEAAVFVNVTYAEVPEPTIVVAVAVLFARFGSVVPEVIFAVSTICVPKVVAAFTVTISVKVPRAWPARSGSVQVTSPVEIIEALELHVHPAGALID